MNNRLEGWWMSTVAPTRQKKAGYGCRRSPGACSVATGESRTASCLTVIALVEERRALVVDFQCQYPGAQRRELGKIASQGRCFGDRFVTRSLPTTAATRQATPNAANLSKYASSGCGGLSGRRDGTPTDFLMGLSSGCRTITIRYLPSMCPPVLGL